MQGIKLFDCTIHEGGYINNWKFCSDVIQKQDLLNEMAIVGTDALDIGVLGEEKKGVGESYYTSFEELVNIHKIKQTQYVLTVLDYSYLEDIELAKVDSIDFIRLVLSTEKDIEQLQNICRELSDIGYKIIFNIETVRDDVVEKLYHFITKLCRYKPDAIILDDVSYGFCMKDVLQLFSRLDSIVDKNICVGYRARNIEWQIGSVIEGLESSFNNRDFIIETSITGISRNVELLDENAVCTFLNYKYGSSYVLARIGILEQIVYKSNDNSSLWKKDELAEMICSHGVEWKYKSIIRDMYLPKQETEYLLKRISDLGLKDVDEKTCLDIIESYRLEVYRKKLAVIIWYDDDSEYVLKNYIDIQAFNIIKSKIDVYFCNVNINGKRSSVVDEYINVATDSCRHIYDSNGIEKNIREIINKYDYIWFNQPEYIIGFEGIAYHVLPFLELEAGIIFVDNDWKHRGNTGIRLLDVDEIIKSKFEQIYSMGTVIYSKELLGAIFSQTKEDIVSEKDFVRELYAYLAHNEIKGIGLCQQLFYENNLYHVFNAKSFYQKWILDLDGLKETLRPIYGEDIDAILDTKDEMYNPYRKKRLIDLKLRSYYTNDVVNSRKDKFSKLLGVAPRFIIKKVMDETSVIGRIARKVLQKRRAYLEKRKEEKYSGLDYSKYVNCVVPQEKVPSDLIYGDMEFVKKPWLTIVVPTYKREDLLEDALESVLRQEDIELPWDIVVVDNEELEEGQESKTERLIREINNPRILYYRNRENLGVAGNYNRGIELARGKWISLLHSDDLLVKGYLPRIAKLIQVYSKVPGKEIGFISTAYQSFFTENLKHEKEWQVELRKRDEQIYNSIKNRDAVLIRVRRAEFMITGAVGVSLPSNGTIMNRNAILEYGGFNDDLGICADMVLPLRLMEKYAVYRTDEVLGHYRVGKRNESAASDNVYKVEKNYNDIREHYYRKSLAGWIMRCIFRQQHFFEIDRILGSHYWKDASLQTIYKHRNQKIRDKIMYGKLGIHRLYYGLQRRWSILKGKILTVLFWRK